MRDQAQLLDLINEAIREISYPKHPEGLFEPIRYILSLGGKRIRPLLTLMSASLYTDNLQPAVSPALGLEVFHNFTLLHDDLMDKADMRRNKPTVHIKWDNNTAILSGDAMQIMAYQLIGKTPAASLQPVLDLFSKTALEICEGQQYDMEFENRADVTAPEYIEMIRLKTAVLLGCALKTGAFVAGAPDADAEMLYRFGENIGLAFQLKDDLLDVYGNPDVFGKKIGGDIFNNKKTFLLITALNNADEKQSAVLKDWIGRKEFDAAEKIKVVTSLYNETGAKTSCERKMEEYFRIGMEALDKVDLSEERKTALRTLAQDLMHREN